MTTNCFDCGQRQPCNWYVLDGRGMWLCWPCRKKRPPYPDAT